MYKKPVFSILFSLGFFTLLSFSLFQKQVFAQVNTAVCKPSQVSYQNLAKDYPDISIQRTGLSVIFVATQDAPCTLVSGANCDTFSSCGAIALTSTAGATNQFNCQVTNQDDCNKLNQVPDPYQVTGPNSFAENGISGSLLGVANALQGLVVSEPLPVSLAFYLNDTASRVPFFGQALAQTPVYSGPFLDMILAVWKLTRNLAYGILAIVMVVIGIMITTRKKINPQLVVSAQTALPRVIIALVLITFSYPIGATMSSLGWSMGFSIHQEVQKISFASPLPLGQTTGFGVGTLLAAIFAVVAAFGGAGPLIIFVTIATVAICLVLLIVALIRVLSVYIKMLFQILGAPIVFALSAVPGNEENVTSWFKRMSAYMLSIPAVWGMIGLTIDFVWQIMTSLIRDGLGGVGYTLFGIAFAPFMLIYGMYTATKMPGYVENWIMGEPKKGGKR